MTNEIIGQVFSTFDYDAFCKLNGNREVLERRKNAIIQSIRERGWIRNPIVVNEKMELIDGQGRFEALRELCMPIQYVIAEGATIDDCIALNIKQNNWQTLDYVKCYADIGNMAYKVLYRLVNDYIGPMSFENIVILASKNNNAGNAGSTRSAIKRGAYELIGDERSIRGLLDYATEVCKVIGKQRGRLRTWIPAIKFAYFCDTIDKDLLLDKMKRYSESISVSVSLDQALSCIEKIYNYNARNGSRVYFHSEYDKYKRGRLRNAAA